MVPNPGKFFRDWKNSSGIARLHQLTIRKVVDSLFTGRDRRGGSGGEGAWKRFNLLMRVWDRTDVDATSGR